MRYTLRYNLTTSGKHTLVIKSHPNLETPSAWDEHDLWCSFEIQGVFHLRHCLKVPLRPHRALHSWDTSYSCVRNCYTGCPVLAPCRPQTHPYHSGYNVSADVQGLSSLSQNLECTILGIFLSERSKYSDPVYLMLPSRRDCLFCEIRRNKRSWLNPGLHTCGNDKRAW